jgi:hypothetical protein
VQDVQGRTPGRLTACCSCTQHDACYHTEWLRVRVAMPKVWAGVCEQMAMHNVCWLGCVLRLASLQLKMQQVGLWSADYMWGVFVVSCQLIRKQQALP